MGGLIFAKFLVIALIVIPWLGVSSGAEYLFGVVVPYAAFLTFVLGIVLKVVNWGKSPVPFRIPTTAGQEKSLPWVKHQPLDNPYTKGQVVARMLLEIFTFRSLFRNTQMEYHQTADGPKIRYGAEYLLWLNALMFHYAFLVVVLWHLRFFMDPVPALVEYIEAIDGFMEVGLPGLLISGVVLFAGRGLSYQPAHREQPDTLHLPGAGLFPPAPDHGHRRHRHPDALLVQGGHGCGQRAHHGPDLLQAGYPRKRGRLCSTSTYSWSACFWLISPSAS